VILTLVLAGAAVTATAVIRPRYLQASGSAPPAPIAARTAHHQQVIDLLGSVVSRSHMVLDVRPPGATPYREIILWLEDHEHLGRIDPDEIGVISHSAVLHTISLHHLAAADDGTDEPTPPLSDLTAPSFGGVWRDRPDVVRRHLASGVETFDVEEIATTGDARSLLCITLTWAADSVDGPDQASVLLDAMLSRDDQ
jgi:hypothetical protein